jgi:hypothetical protein
MRRKAHVPFGKGLTEKDPNHGHLAGGLLHSGRGGRKRSSNRSHLAGDLLHCTPGSEGGCTEKARIHMGYGTSLCSPPYPDDAH